MAKNGWVEYYWKNDSVDCWYSVYVSVYVSVCSLFFKKTLEMPLNTPARFL